MAYELYTVQQYMDALYKGDRSVMSEEILKEVNTEYIDTAGLYETEEFQKVSHIHYINNRINTIKLEIALQKRFLSEFGVPFINQFEWFKKRFGHRLVWKCNELDILECQDDFLEQLKKIELKENKYISTVEKDIKELIEMRDKKNSKKVSSNEESRGSFIRTLISLRKLNYVIVNTVTTVEELSWMIKMQQEAVNESKKNNFK